MENTTLQPSRVKSTERFKIWLLQAHYDLMAAEASLGSRNYEWSCYQSVQSVEKALKSVIIHAGWRSPNTHKLGVLLSMCNKANHLFSDIKFNYRKIEAYTFISRYPFVFPDQKNLPPHDLINKNDALTCVSVATDIYNKVEAFLSNNIVQVGTPLDLEHYYFTADDVDKRVLEVVGLLKNCDELEVEKIILFGSFAREKTRPKTSTMDILVIADTGLGFIERIEYVRNLTKGGEPIVEPLIYTPSEFEHMLMQEGEGYLESAIDEGKVIFNAEDDRRKAAALALAVKSNLPA